jgi:hypothetical protein
MLATNHSPLATLSRGTLCIHRVTLYLRTGLSRAKDMPTISGVGLHGRHRLQLDDHLRQLLRELGHAINDSVADSEKINTAIGNVRSAGYDIVLKLDATIGLAKRESNSSAAKLSHQDRRFLESLHIQVDAEALEEETTVPKFDLTAQDVRFLKSLKISLDGDEE